MKPFVSLRVCFPRTFKLCGSAFKVPGDVTADRGTFFFF